MILLEKKFVYLTASMEFLHIKLGFKPPRLGENQTK